MESSQNHHGQFGQSVHQGESILRLRCLELALQTEERGNVHAERVVANARTYLDFLEGRPGATDGDAEGEGDPAVERALRSYGITS